MSLIPEEPASPPEAWEPLHRMVRLARRPLEAFFRIEAASGVVLLAAAAVALAWANSPWAGSYQALWHTPVGVQVGALALERTLEWVVNDGLMVIFFFVVGMEIRRELHDGELSDVRRAALPVAAALGGMLVPAAFFLLVAGGPETRAGWGVPMATDIAFAVGVLALLGERVPPALRVLLLALAVIDDLGAIVVIAIAYSTGVKLVGLGAAGLGLGLILALQRLGARSWMAYVPPGLVIWGGVAASGIHPTIAGVVIGLVTPVRAWLGPDGFILGVRKELEHLAGQGEAARPTHQLARTLRHVDEARREAMSPAESLIERLHPWVAYAIMPLFALANAGVAIDAAPVEGAAALVMAGVGFGLVLGKPAGVLLACAVALRSGLALLPTGVTWRHLVVLGTVAGLGFTMSLFIAPLAFGDPGLLAASKLGVLAATGVAGCLTLGLGWVLLRPVRVPGAATTADEAERSTTR